MTKAILIKLGKLKSLKERLHNEWCDSGYSDELLKKCTLVQKVFKCLEENARGFQKSKIPYPLMADYLILNAEKFSYDQLHSKICKIIFEKPKNRRCPSQS